jgi:hypothetical protein
MQREEERTKFGRNVVKTRDEFLTRCGEEEPIFWRDGVDNGRVWVRVR